MKKEEYEKVPMKNEVYEISHIKEVTNEIGVTPTKEVTNEMGVISHMKKVFTKKYENGYSISIEFITIEDLRNSLKEIKDIENELFLVEGINKVPSTDNIQTDDETVVNTFQTKVLPRITTLEELGKTNSWLMGKLKEGKLTSATVEAMKSEAKEALMMKTSNGDYLKPLETPLPDPQTDKVVNHTANSTNEANNAVSSPNEATNNE